LQFYLVIMCSLLHLSYMNPEFSFHFMIGAHIFLTLSFLTTWWLASIVNLSCSFFLILLIKSDGVWSKEILCFYKRFITNSFFKNCINQANILRVLYKATLPDFIIIPSLLSKRNKFRGVMLIVLVHFTCLFNKYHGRPY
jgi:hypothetical protein